MEPDEESRLSDGVLVETALVARVLGMRLLRVDGTVLLAPARLHARSVRSASTESTTVVTSSLVPDTRSLEPGARLVQAARLLRDNGERMRLLP
jgi:hypothetical protein